MLHLSRETNSQAIAKEQFKCRQCGAICNQFLIKNAIKDEIMFIFKKTIIKYSIACGSCKASVPINDNTFEKYTGSIEGLLKAESERKTPFKIYVLFWIWLLLFWTPILSVILGVKLNNSRNEFSDSLKSFWFALACLTFFANGAYVVVYMIMKGLI